MVYSLKMDAWRKGPDVPYYFYYHNGRCAFVNGNIYWVGECDAGTPVPIVAFDVKDETFSSVPLPDYDSEYSGNLCVEELDGCLCLSVNYICDSDMWILKEDDSSVTWSMLLIVAKNEPYNHLERPIGYSISRKELFVRISLLQVACIDLETMSTRDIKVADFLRCLDANLCVENLLMLDYYAPNILEEEPLDEKNGKKGGEDIGAFSSSIWLP